LPLWVREKRKVLVSGGWRTNTNVTFNSLLNVDRNNVIQSLPLLWHFWGEFELLISG